MIRTCIFAQTPETLRVREPGASTFGGPSFVVNPWVIYQQMLEAGDDTLIWIITRKQYNDFMERVKTYGLEKYLIQKHECDGIYYDKDADKYKVKEGSKEQGVLNHNYMGDPKKLKIFVMKGAKA